jgi:exo-1,4-beta-D-glucosaminidase
MPRLRLLAFSLVGISLGVAAMHVPASLADESGKILLNHGWELQSSCEVKASGAQVSAVGFDATKWHHTDLPSTVVGALVNDKTYPDPTYGTNLKSLPGMDYSSKTFFAMQDMPKDSPFLCSWWFRTEFALPADIEGKAKWLHFLGINYRANLWINGQKIADAKDIS